MPTRNNQESDSADGRIIRLHVEKGNLQSICTKTQFNDFLVKNIDDFDVFFVSETWKDAKEESYSMTGGSRMCLRAALFIKQLGRSWAPIFHSQLRDIFLHIYSPKIFAWKCSLSMLELELLAVYFPTFWDDIIEAGGLHWLHHVATGVGTRGGKRSRIFVAFQASDELQRLRLRRRLAQDCGELRRLSLQIRTLHRREFRA